MTISIFFSDVTNGYAMIHWNKSKIIIKNK